jgi:hypothetical protein
MLSHHRLVPAASEAGGDVGVPVRLTMNIVHAVRARFIREVHDGMNEVLES